MSPAGARTVHGRIIAGIALPRATSHPARGGLSGGAANGTISASP